MAKTTNELNEGFSLAGTFLFSQKADAEGVAAMLGLSGAFPMQTDEGLFWMPGQNYDELMKRIFSDWVLPDKATVPQAHPQEPQRLTFLAYLDKHGRA
jgi:hypothetical protein